LGIQLSQQFRGVLLGDCRGVLLGDRMMGLNNRIRADRRLARIIGLTDRVCIKLTD
jgi:hypothetical protein